MSTLVEELALSNYAGVGRVGAVAQECAPKSAGGIQRVWVGDRFTFGTWRLEETSPLQYGQISGSSLPGTWYELRPQWQAANYTEAQEGVPARAYVATLNLPYSRMSVAHRDLFERLAASNKSVLLAEDLNGNAWLFGEHDGCLVTTNFDSQQAAATGRYVLVADCRQTWPLRQVNAAFLAAVKAGSSATPPAPTSWSGATITSFVNLQIPAIQTLVR